MTDEELRLTPEPEIAWEKLRLPDEEDEDDFEGGYSDEPKLFSQLLTPVNQNPFFQLKTYNFWTGHTNFKITKAMALILSNVSGIESLDIVSPYRFHISIGHRFKETEVKVNFTSTAIAFLNEKNRRNQ